MSARSLVVLALALPALVVAGACSGSSAPKPLPNLPPPEYEAPRAFDAGGIDDLPGAEPSPAPPAAATAPAASPTAPAAPPSSSAPAPSAAPSSTPATKH